LGFFKNFIVGAAGLKTYQNVFNKPVVVPPPGFVVRGMKQQGLGSTWVVTYSKTSSMNMKSNFKIRKGTSAVSVGANKFTIDWP
tara:strand:+ start:1037 stop:1288 length:252 start_codon:yes stop_codon:yes gene_type:complete